MIRLSPTALDTYNQCPALYKRRYVQRLRDKPTPALAVGNAVHKAMEVLNYERQKKSPMAFEELRRVYDEAFKQEAPKVGAWNDKTPESEQERGFRMLARIAAATRDMMPAEVEQWFEFPLLGRPGFTLAGKIDAVLDDGTLVDYKTASKPWHQKKLDEQRQPALYANARLHLTGQAPSKFIFVVADAATDGVKPFPVDVTPAAIRNEMDKVREIADAITAGDFTPGRSCRFCPMNGAC